MNRFTSYYCTAPLLSDCELAHTYFMIKSGQRGVKKIKCAT